MTKIELRQRIEGLRNVISWSYEHGGLSSGQRICIHQEIAGLLQQIEALEIGSFIYGSYQIPAHLEEKVQHFLQVIENTNWEKSEIKY